MLAVGSPFQSLWPEGGITSPSCAFILRRRLRLPQGSRARGKGLLGMIIAYLPDVLHLVQRSLLGTGGEQDGKQCAEASKSDLPHRVNNLLSTAKVRKTKERPKGWNDLFHPFEAFSLFHRVSSCFIVFHRGSSVKDKNHIEKHKTPCLPFVKSWL